MSSNRPLTEPLTSCESCKITLRPDEKIETRMGDPDGFFCSDPACPIMRAGLDSGHPTELTTKCATCAMTLVAGDLDCGQSGCTAERDLARAVDWKRRALLAEELARQQAVEIGHLEQVIADA